MTLLQGPKYPVLLTLTMVRLCYSALQWFMKRSLQKWIYCISLLYYYLFLVYLLLYYDW